MATKDLIFVSLIIILIILLLFAVGKYLYQRHININNFAIYKGTPSEINGVTNIETALKQYAKYDAIILGGGWELDVSGDHENTKEIIRRSKTKFYGSVDVSTNGMNYELKEINERIHKWYLMGASGIYLENFKDAEFARNREILSYVKMHPSSFRAIIPTTLNSNLENYDTGCCILMAMNLAINDGTLLNAHDALMRIKKLRNQKHHQIWSHNTMDKNNIIYEMHLNYSYHLSSVLGCAYFSFANSQLGGNYLEYKALPIHPYQYQLWTTPIMFDNQSIKRKTTGYLVEVDIEKSKVSISPLFKYGYVPADYIR